MSLASLPMYDWPEVRAETDALWAALAQRIARCGLAVPETLTRDRPLNDVWADPDLLLSQTCGLPYVMGAARGVRIVCTPVYAAEGCDAGVYRSAIVVRRDGPSSLSALRGARFAVNGPDSLSGWAALLNLIGVESIGDVEWTGAHRASVVAVAEGRAEAAAIDAVAWDLARRFEPAAADLRVLDWTAPAPALPFVTSALTPSADRARLRAALIATLAGPAVAAARAALRLERIVAFADTDYDEARRLAALVRAAARSRPDLHP